MKYLTSLYKAAEDIYNKEGNIKKAPRATWTFAVIPVIRQKHQLNQYVSSVYLNCNGL